MAYDRFGNFIDETDFRPMAASDYQSEANQFGADQWSARQAALRAIPDVPVDPIQSRMAGLKTDYDPYRRRLLSSDPGFGAATQGQNVMAQGYLNGTNTAGTNQRFLADPRLAGMSPEQRKAAYKMSLGLDLDTDIQADLLSERYGKSFNYNEVAQMAGTPKRNADFLKQIEDQYGASAAHVIQGHDPRTGKITIPGKPYRDADGNMVPGPPTVFDAPPGLIDHAKQTLNQSMLGGEAGFKTEEMERAELAALKAQAAMSAAAGRPSQSVMPAPLGHDPDGRAWGAQQRDIATKYAGRSASGGMNLLKMLSNAGRGATNLGADAVNAFSTFTGITDEDPFQSRLPYHAMEDPMQTEWMTTEAEKARRYAAQKAARGR